MSTRVDHVPRVLVLGSSGFIGSRVVASLAGSGGAHVVALSRKPPARLRNNNATIATADISVPGSLSPFLRDTDVVIHAASYVGSEPRLAQEINEAGTGHVVEQCRRAGVARLIYVSTCSVYGSGPHRGILESEAGYHPASVASASRAVAEQLVLGYGGEVVRPNLVFGAGDRWFVPGLLKLMKVAGGWPGDGSALLSLIGVEALGGLLSGLALAPGQPGRAFHAAYPEPVPVSFLLQNVARVCGVEYPTFLGDDERAGSALRAAGFSGHQIDLVTKDHWYSSERLWRISGREPETFGSALGEFASSYQVPREPARS
ncbi:NAD-dependent epimerase/dehydratase family protein [Arthrobacter sp. FW306-2-2C-D06B]|uniref:NAD-dependent epimerase/dehydratase family protein n=1 Tax=Arthrobacter sp. FW306-2-2C-D06B TaxID=2879618 RepID=UPI001F2B2544|nr:NAD(P)-dependent oxidoreductase [Arthrobacter sp. FW306-2-2C-D06B]UKA57201.1 NAD(P)-dependent oxidoreductase [Arthrobacter sp. FW306-2-2C-D06B]